MSDRIEEIRGDLAFMRGLVQQGDSGGRARGGAIIALGGFLFAGCSLVVGAAANGWLPQSSWTLAYPWFITMGLFLALLFTLLRRTPEAGTVRARASGALWSAIGMAIGTLVASCLAAQVATGSPYVWTVLPSVVFALYGAGWLVAGSLGGRGWERWVGFGGFLAAVGIAALASAPRTVFFAYAAGLVLLAGVPGLVMTRDRAGA